MTFDEFVAEWRKQVREYGGEVSQEAFDMAEQSWEIAFAAGAASRDAEVSRIVEKCHDFAAQHETDSGIIESDGKEIHFLREQRDQLQREVAELKSKLFDLTKQRDALSRMADSLEQERDQLHEQVAMLRIALFVIQDNSDDIGVIERALEALEKTEPK